MDIITVCVSLDHLVTYVGVGGGDWFFLFASPRARRDWGLAIPLLLTLVHSEGLLLGEALFSLSLQSMNGTDSWGKVWIWLSLLWQWPTHGTGLKGGLASW